MKLKSSTKLLNKIPPKPWSFILFMTRPYTKKFALFFLLTFIGVLMWALGPYILSLFVDKIITSRELSPAAWMLFWIYVLSRFVEEWFWRIAEFVARSFLPQLAVEPRAALYKAVKKRNYWFFVNSSSGQLGHWINESSRLLNEIIESTIWSVWPLLMMTVMNFFLLLTVNVTIAGLFFGWFVGLLGFLLWRGKKYSVLNAAVSEEKSKASGVVVDSLTNYVPVRIFGGGGREDTEIARANDRIVSARRKEWWYGMGMHAVKGNSAALASGLCLLVAALQFEKGTITVGSIVLVITYITTTSHNIWELAWQLDSYYRNFGELENILTNVLDVGEKEKRDFVGSHTIDANVSSSSGARDSLPVVFKDVSFAYPEMSHKDVLTCVSITISPGEKIGLIGKSGSGKSTLISLLLGLYTPTNGDILYGSTPILSLKEDVWRNEVSYVPQDTSLFNRTVMDNIRYARPDATDEDVYSAALEAQADGFIRELKEGYSTFIGERGVKLSGGQRQRIAIARAIIRQSPILVLDEATSALDSESEHAIQKALLGAMKGKSVLVIAHRLSTIKHLDKILVLDKGKIVEQGNHEALMKINGTYASLWKKQRDGFIQE
jgi:ATP-binding cassette, subfamily B, bacterial